MMDNQIIIGHRRGGGEREEQEVGRLIDPEQPGRPRRDRSARDKEGAQSETTDTTHAKRSSQPSLRPQRIRLRLEVENTVQRGMSAPRELPKAPSVEMLPRPVRIASARFRRPVAAAEALGHI